jgi:DNA-binding IclR family transcriptional regulator
LARDPASKEKRRGIQSVEIGLRILAAAASHRGAATLSSIAQRSGVSVSQTHRYLSSLMAAGMIKQEQRSGLYDLDAEAIRLGLAALSRIDAFRQADEVFSDFAAKSGRTCLVAIWGDYGPTIVRWFDGSPPVITSLAIGSVLPLLRSATGRVFFAFASPDQIARLGKETLEQEHVLVPNAIAIQQATRSDMTASVRGDLIPGLRAVAAPVFDLQGRLVLVASALSNSAAPGSDSSAKRYLLEACRTLTEALGGSWPLQPK